MPRTTQPLPPHKHTHPPPIRPRSLRSWFNGPALLTWSRGQNEYGSNIGGPLPRSWMQEQWALQRQILARYRSLGVVGQQPGFQVHGVYEPLSTNR
jgi:alpha-N-acetylglucosaminidase